MLNQETNSRDYQKILEQQILKLNFRSFTQVVILIVQPLYHLEQLNQI